MKPFDYVRPDRIQDALALLQEHGSQAAVLAGGTDLIVKLRRGSARPRVVIDIKRICDLRADIAEVKGSLRIGALATMADIVDDPRANRYFPALVEAARVVGSVQIRNRATLAGNICNASPAADTAPALLVYKALVNLKGTSGCRVIRLEDFFTGPGKTERRFDEIVDSIDLPIPLAPTGAAFGRITRRKGVDLATINLCCLVNATGESRAACGAVGPRPFVVNDSTDEGALRRMIGQAAPITDVRGSREYRLAMLRVMGRRTFQIARAKLLGVG